MYRYVRSKDELIVLVHEKAIGAPPELPAGWRPAATAWVTRPGRPVRRTPVAARHTDPRRARTPNLLRWAEVMLQAFAETGR